MHRLLPILRIFLTALLAIVCVCGDWLVGLNSNSPIAKAIFDNATHAGVGLLTAAILFIQLERRISSAERNAAIIVCCLVSSIIDIDHFIAARSWKLTVCIRQIPFFKFNVQVPAGMEGSNRLPDSVIAIYTLLFLLECNTFATTADTPLHHHSIAASGRCRIRP